MLLLDQAGEPFQVLAHQCVHAEVAAVVVLFQIGAVQATAIHRLRFPLRWNMDAHRVAETLNVKRS